MKSTTKSRPTPRSAKPTGSKPAKKPHTAPKTAKLGKAPPVAAKGKRPPTRGDEVMELLQRKGGCTMDELVKRTGLLQHTLRAVISVESRKRLLEVELVGRGHYRIVK